MMDTRPMANGTYDLPLPQIWRRRLVVLGQLCGIVPFVIAVVGLRDNLALLVVFVVLLVVSAACHTRLAMSIQNIAQVNPANLDERQRATRDRAFVLSLRYLGWALTAAWVYAMIAGIAGWWLPDVKNLGFLLWGFGMMVYGYPTAIAAWIEPDPVKD